MMTKNGFCAGVLVLALAALRLAVAAEDPVFDNLYGEDGNPAFVEGKAWKERKFVLPAYPDTDSRDLIEVDLSINGFPFRLLIDPASVSAGEDWVVRYTAILKSRSGATNVFYEGIRCATSEFRRYANGGPEGFKLSTTSRWRYIRSSGGSSRYRNVLLDRFICPAPAPGKPGAVLRRLRAPNPDNFFYGNEE